MIEMKNVREWMFPRSHQLFQVLSKAAALQTAHPDQQILPMIVCRRKHIQSLWMANDLGFAVIEVKRQFLLPSAEYTPEDVEQVRAALGFDLHIANGPYPLLVDILNTTLPPRAEAMGTRWRQFGSAFGDMYDVLADDEVEEEDRADVLDELRAANAQHPETEAGW
jgi:hypothetical protein